MEQTRLVFDALIEGVFNKAFGKSLTPEMKSEMRAAGIDLDRKLLPAYPYEAWERCMRIAAKGIFGRESPEAFQTMGERYLEVFRATLLGAALFQVARLIGPRRAMLRTSKYRSIDNFTKATARELAPNLIEIRYEAIGGIPQFAQGAMIATLRAVNAKDPKVEITEFDGSNCVFRASWSL
jgi:uncharacterized protein (TIGR02265 family)